MYWVYDLPTWLFGTLAVIVFVAFGLAGLYLLRGWVRRIDNGHARRRESAGAYW